MSRHPSFARHLPINRFDTGSAPTTLVVTTGTAADEQILGTASADTLNGAGGNDTLIGGDGADSLIGGIGDDRLGGEAGNDTLAGGTGYDGAVYRFDLAGAGSGITFNASTTGVAGTIVLNAGLFGTDTLSGIEYVLAIGTGFGDTFTGGRGNDILIGAGGADTIVGGDGNDFLSGLTNFGEGEDPGAIDAADSLTGGNGNDTLRGNSGNDTLTAGAGNDNLRGDAGNDVMNGGLGVDGASYRFDELGLVAGVAFNAGLIGTVGTVMLGDGRGGTDTLTGIEFAILTGTNLNDSLDGSLGGDQLDGLDGNDSLVGGQGDDFNITGGTGNDTLRGNDGSDTLGGGAGIDWLDGGTGVDSVDGGADNDVVFFESGTQGASINLQTGVIANDGFGNAETIANVENLHATQHDDTIVLSGVDSYVFARAGDDSITGGAGGNNIFPGSGSDTVDGGAGFDIVVLGDDGYDGAGPATQGAVVNLATGSIVDYWGKADSATNVEMFRGGSRGDRMTGDGFDNTFAGDGGADTLAGGDGNDVLFGFKGGSGTDPLAEDGADSLNGGNGNDLLRGNSGNDTLYGGAGDDNLRGDAGNDVLTGGTGIDFVSYRFDEPGFSSGVNFSTALIGTAGTVSIGDGQGGTDTVSGIETTGISGTAFDDTLSGGALIDQIAGNNGNDSIAGGGGNDEGLLGNAGNDTINGGAGNDWMAGGAGNDSLIGGFGIDLAGYADASAAVSVNLKTGTAGGTDGNDVLSGIENIEGSAFDDTLTGDTNSNTLYGGSGNDTVRGGAGNDTLNGGPGNDLLTGGAGNDAFQFQSAADGIDQLSDFATGADSLELDHLEFAALGDPGALAAGVFALGTSAADADDRLIYDGATGKLYYDADGNGGASEALLFAQFAPGTTLQAGDIVIVT